MPRPLQSILAVAAALAMVVGAVAVRSALDRREVERGLTLRLVCAIELAGACDAARAADPRVQATVESPDATLRRLSALDLDDDPDVDAWLTVGPWAQMLDTRPGARPLFTLPAIAVASTPIVYAFAPRRPHPYTCDSPLAGCVASEADGNPGPMLDDPASSGVGLVALAQMVLAASGRAAAELSAADLTAEEPGAKALANLKGERSRQRPDVGQLANASGALGNPVVTTEAAVSGIPRIDVQRSEPPVLAVAELAVRDPALLPVAEAAARAAGAHLREQAWTAPPAAGGTGLPDAGTLAALRRAWAAA